MVHKPLANKVFVKYDRIHRACQVIARKVVMSDVKDYDYILGINRGGLIPAVILSHMLKVPHIPICYSAPDGNGDDKNSRIDLPVMTDKKLLII